MEFLLYVEIDFEILVRNFRAHTGEIYDNGTYVLFCDVYNLFFLQTSIHEDFIQQCDERLKADFDTLMVIKDDVCDTKLDHANKMMRVLTVLREYLAECDERYIGERRSLPLCR